MRNWTPEQLDLLRWESNDFICKKVAVLADAGSGKTSVLVERVKTLLANQAPDDHRSVLCISFTQKSAADLSDRLAEFPKAEVYTIHGFCARIVTEFASLLNLPPYISILDEQKASLLLRDVFEKNFRRSPLPLFQHQSETFFTLCKMKVETPNASLTDFSDTPHLEPFLDTVLEDYHRSKAKMRALDYQDLEVFASEILRNDFQNSKNTQGHEKTENPAKIIASRYSHIFVNEFQDTNEDQCEMVRVLMQYCPRLFVVGDFKQSIYRFRGAQVEVFNKFVSTLPEKRRLSYNFRSHPDIINAVNSVFENTMPGFEPMRAAREDSTPSGLKQTCVFKFSVDTEDEGVLNLLERLQKSHVDLSKVVLLFRKLKGKEKLLYKLSKAGFPISTVSSGTVRADKKIQSLMNLWLCFSSCSVGRKAHLLRAAQVYVDFGNGSNLPNDSQSDRRARLLQELKNDNLFFVRFNTFVSPVEFLAELNRVFQLEKIIGVTFLQFKALIIRLQNEGLSVGRIATEFSRFLNDESSQLTGFSLVTAPSHLFDPTLGDSQKLQSILQAMTIHASKGLEFDHVILPDLKDSTLRASGVIKADGHLWILSRNDEGKLDKSPEVLADALELEKDATSAEASRLLYVAMTRARENLFILETEKLKSNWKNWLSVLSPKSLENFEFTNFVDLNKDLAQQLKSTPELARPSTSREHLAHTDEFSSPLVLEKPIYSKSRYGVVDLVSDRELNLNASFHSHGTIACDLTMSKSDLGTLVHSCLEFEKWSELKQIEREQKLDLKYFWNWLDTEIGKKIFPQSVQERSRSRVENEWAFDLWHANKMIVGRIDKLIADASTNTAWIIDYKLLFSHRTVQDVKMQYQPQLEVYSLAVQKMLKSYKVESFILDVLNATGSILISM